MTTEQAVPRDGLQPCENGAFDEKREGNQEMNLRIRPDGNDRFVTIEHVSWNSQWRMQFPEAISAKEGAIMAWPSNCRPEWERLSDGWGYSWRTTEAYGADVRAMNHRDTAGNPQ